MTTRKWNWNRFMISAIIAFFAVMIINGIWQSKKRTDPRIDRIIAEADEVLSYNPDAVQAAIDEQPEQTNVLLGVRVQFYGYVHYWDIAKNMMETVNININEDGTFSDSYMTTDVSFQPEHQFHPGKMMVYFEILSVHSLYGGTIQAWGDNETIKFQDPMMTDLTEEPECLGFYTAKLMVGTYDQDMQTWESVPDVLVGVLGCPPDTTSNKSEPKKGMAHGGPWVPDTVTLTPEEQERLDEQLRNVEPPGPNDSLWGSPIN